MGTVSQGRWRDLILIVLGLGLVSVTPASRAAVALELDRPALKSQLGLKRPLMAVALAGSRLVTVGRMGGIYYSDDGGHRWSQAEVPVSVDLTAVQFVNPRQGWATGHDGVVLGSDDGGAHWRLLLDGRRAATLMRHAYPPAAPDVSPAVAMASEEAQRYAEEDGARPFLDLCFLDTRLGYVVGAWGLIFRTNDGGQTWQPWLRQTDNPGALHLNAIRRIGEELWIVGERGLMLRQRPGSEQFIAVDSPSTGSYFGLIGSGDLRIVYGLEGKVFLSRDAGRDWRAVPLSTQGAITAADIRADGLVMLADGTGKAWISHQGGAFKPLLLRDSMPYYALQLHDETVTLVGMQGVRTQPLPATR
jgi:photosystem II stability/assembly factor-like uncharacterized protein